MPCRGRSSSAIDRATITPASPPTSASYSLLEPGAAQSGAVALHGLPVATRDRPGQVETVLDRPLQQRYERLGWRARLLEELRRSAVEGDEEVRGDRRACVVARTLVVGELNGCRPRVSASQSARACASSDSAVTAPQAPSSCSGPRARRQRLQRVHREALEVGVECRERCAAGNVREPGAGLERARDLGDRAVGHAQQPQLPVVTQATPRSRRRAAIAEPARPAPMTVTSLNMLGSSSDSGYRAPLAYPTRCGSSWTASGSSSTWTARSCVPNGPWLEEVPTVVLLPPGPGADHSTYKDVLGPGLAQIAQVVYVDPRGDGRSDRSTPSRWNLDTWSSDLHQLLDALEIERPILLGSSTGALVALQYAAQHPDVRRSSC